jgi:hypothetical protein
VRAVHGVGRRVVLHRGEDSQGLAAGTTRDVQPQVLATAGAAGGGGFFRSECFSDVFL